MCVFVCELRCDTIWSMMEKQPKYEERRRTEKKTKIENLYTRGVVQIFFSFFFSWVLGVSAFRVYSRRSAHTLFSYLQFSIDTV